MSGHRVLRFAGAVLGTAATLTLATKPAASRAPAPAVPAVHGPLDLRVVFPAAGDPAPGSRYAYLIGSVGNGRARLTVNGRAVGVLPNGAFLAYLPAPPAGDSAYRLEATLDGRTVTRVVPLSRGPDVPPPAPPSPAADAAAGWAVLRRAGPAPPGEGVAVRPVPGGTYRWFLLSGTRLEVTGRRGDEVRVRLDDDLEGWVAARDVHPSPAGAVPPSREAGHVAVSEGAEWTEVSIAVAEPPPFLVRAEGSAVTLTLYGTRGNTRRVDYPSRRGWLRSVWWEPERDGRVRYVAELAGPAYGYRVLWREGALVLRLRHPPRTARWRSPLEGKVVAVDAGHPPHGATGPTGLREAEVTLHVARRLERILRRRGARVVLTRPDAGPVGLETRVARAEAAGAHALVSIHVDAVPAGRDPRGTQGTATHFSHGHAHALAREVQGGMVRRLGLADRGVSLRSLAVTRPTWLPAVLCEGATLVVPEHEALLRTSAFQEAYARGIADGLEAFFTAAGRDAR